MSGVNFDRLIVPPPTVTQVSYWATVTQTSPLRIQLDGDPGPLPFTPDTLVAGLQQDDRVWVALTTNDDPMFRARRVVVLGKAGGLVMPTPMPPGAIVEYAGSNAPDGWLMCDGGEYSRTTYAALYAAIGTTYGVGDGTTTFNVPNIKGRAPVGLDSTQSEFDALGKVGGEKAVTLTLDQLPPHDHNGVATAPYITDGSFDGELLSTAAGGDYGFRRAAGPSVGGGQAHNNLQPYIVLNYIIKT